ncbi:MAG: 30S ribosomal protein S14 [Promethearchaeota archaeon]
MHKMSEPKKKFGKGTRTCRRCGTHRAVIRKYGLYICRRCIREIADDLGFRKY